MMQKNVSHVTLHQLEKTMTLKFVSVDLSMAGVYRCEIDGDSSECVVAVTGETLVQEVREQSDWCGVSVRINCAESF